MPRLNLAVTISAGSLFLLAPALAEAHFKLNSPACWLSQDSVGGPQKNGPCAAVPNTGLGDVAGTPTGMVSAFQPGQTVSVSVTATIAHPGWWRIALHQGASSTQTLTTIPDPQAQAGTNCTPAIIANPVWSPTQPVLADGLPAGSVATTSQTGTNTFQVTIPQNASCTSASPCTLQVIMVMTDHPANDCYYHHCADLAAAGAGTGGATGAGTGGVTGAGIGGTTGTGIGGATGGGTGGATGGGTGTGGANGNGGNGSGGSGVAVSDAGSVPPTELTKATAIGGCSCVLGATQPSSLAGGFTMLAVLWVSARRRRRRSPPIGR
jgi:MYXO-CTERM domain-containing protein